MALAASGEARMSPERHQLAAAVRDLDADGRLARDGGQDPHVGRGHGVGDVLRQRRHPGHLHPGPELQLVAGDRRADRAAHQPGVDPVGRQGADQGGAGRVHLGLVDRPGPWPASAGWPAGGASPRPAGPSASRAARPCRAGWRPRAASPAPGPASSAGSPVDLVGCTASSGSSGVSGADRGHRRLASLGQGPAERVGGLVDGVLGGRRRPGRPGRRRSASGWPGPGRRRPCGTDTPVKTRIPTAAITVSTTAAPEPAERRPERVGHGGTDPPAGRRQLGLVEARRAGDPPARAASPDTDSSTRVPPMTARAGSRRTRSPAPGPGG